ncbi:hypothetical protein Pan97_00920 [Bremerella volcania]|uniref:DUF3616 domain-containing protein n=1 Tax=Bremerella volcania TaxID=2527984 RepID=A0A518C1M2_9BACT|nr:DUF3616 domain-containing protein [Bremerella volcania]QDU73125.1 hypothetical protein Pan97_00920 [Bremerella volcania]
MQQLGLWTFRGQIDSSNDISAIAVIEGGQFVAIAGDEGASVQILRRRGPGDYDVHDAIDLSEQLDDDESEIDIEGLAFSGGRLYVLGSHSKRRAKLDPRSSQKENRKLLKQRDKQPDRQGLFEIDYLGVGKFASEVKSCDLLPTLKADKTLSPFLAIPSKENGIDLEGLAAHGDDLIVGFRGPILREGLVPILKLDFDKPDDADLLFVHFGGRGVRDLVRTSSVYLVLAGPMRDEPISYRIYLWNGEDATPGHDRDPASVPRLLGEVPLPHLGAKPEGIGLIEETDAYFDVVLVCDSSPMGSPTVLRIAKPID